MTFLEGIKGTECVLYGKAYMVVSQLQSDPVLKIRAPSLRLSNGIFDAAEDMSSWFDLQVNRVIGANAVTTKKHSDGLAICAAWICEVAPETAEEQRRSIYPPNFGTQMLHVVHRQSGHKQVSALHLRLGENEQNSRWCISSAAELFVTKQVPAAVLQFLEEGGYHPDF